VAHTCRMARKSRSRRSSLSRVRSHSCASRSVVSDGFTRRDRWHISSRYQCVLLLKGLIPWAKGL
jgi:hypothetical protein